MEVSEIIVELMVKDVDATVSFYREALGFQLLASEQDSAGRSYWAKMSFEGFLISFKEELRLKQECEFMREKEVGGSMSICVVVEEIELLHARFEEKFLLLDHPHLTPCGATQFSLMDNNGYILTFMRFS